MSLLDDMRSERLYDYSSPELAESFRHASRLCCRLRSLYPGHPDYRAVLEELIPGIPESATIVAPFYCDHGHGIRLGEDVFLNADCVLLDGGLITIGAHTRIGPKCQLYTPAHPLDAVERRRPVETAHPITIGEDCWLGGGVIVCPGVTIGDRSIIAAGSVVTRDIPSDCLAAGNPAVVKRHLRTSSPPDLSPSP